MRWSETFIPTQKENPKEAEVASHNLMLRAGLIRRLAAGVYIFLPLGIKVLRKLERIIRVEMDRSGAQEILMPTLIPAELWEATGRWDVYGQELMRVNDRNKRKFALGPTHEEVVTNLVRSEIHSYRQLPVTFYQIQTKFRDEIRPRFGIMRGREFSMKDAYSFDRNDEGLEKSYQKMYEAYKRIFSSCGLKFRAVEADTGPIGGSFSHEFMVLADTGEDYIAVCNSCEYAANINRAKTRLEENSEKGVSLEPVKEVSTPGMKSIEDVGKFLKIPAEKFIKILFYEIDNEIIATLIRGDLVLNETKLSNYFDGKEVRLAEEEKIIEATNGPVGFSGPVGLKNIKTFADHSVQNIKNGISGANKEDTHLINVNLERDFSVNEFLDLRTVKAGDRCPCCAKELEIIKGIEVGHVFKLGTKYSKALKANFLDEDGKERFITMGCYGIGVGRTIAASIEQNHDKDGIIWPLPLSPYQVIITLLDLSKEEIKDIAEKIHQDLIASGIEVLFDDREENPGVKFKDADLIGVPIRITVGPKRAVQNEVEIRWRQTGENFVVKKEEVVKEVKKLISSCKS